MSDSRNWTNYYNWAAMTQIPIESQANYQASFLPSVSHKLLIYTRIKAFNGKKMIPAISHRTANLDFKIESELKKYSTLLPPYLLLSQTPITQAK